MSTDGPSTYTRQTLAAACGISVRQLIRHIAGNTLRIGDAQVRIPGVGLQFQASKASRFIAAMRAKQARKLEGKV